MSEGPRPAATGTAHIASAPATRMPTAIWALALGTFAIGVTEFVIAGLLPLVADAFGNRVPCKTMLVLLTGVLVLGNLVTAVAPSFGWALAGR